ncbi:MAG: DUF6588 family protein [Nitrospirota bacterium]
MSIHPKRGSRPWVTALVTAALGVAELLPITPTPAHAAKYDIEIPDNVLTQSMFKDLSEQIGLALAYRPLAPAEPLGLLGFDIGIEATGVGIDNDEAFWTVINPDLPSYLVFPKLHVQKGLPLGIDVGFVYTKLPSSNVAMYGGELKWAIRRGSLATPAVALRGTYTTLAGVDTLDASTYGADVSISKGFGPLTPYAGIGQTWIQSSTEALSTSSVPLSDESISSSHFFVGTKLRLALFSFALEADFAAVQSYSLRMGLGF